MEQLEIRHQKDLASRFQSLNVSISEYTFPSLYLFRKKHVYEVCIDREIFIRGRTYDGHVYLMPTSDVRTIDPAVLRNVLNEGEFLFPIPEEWLTAFHPDEYEVTFVDGDTDYVYTVEKMSTYAGRHLHGKRNLLKQFLDTYDHDARPLLTTEEARFILDDWQKTSESSVDETDYGPCLDALERYDELSLCGGIYYADHEPCGFVIGEEVNATTFVLHFAKGRTKFKGVYQYMFNQFAKVLSPHYRYINLEQDLNKENLRVFKSSYAPDIMLRKARVRLK
ncbi:MAG: DUF2156 domain-containing protein [Nitrospirota bacterium]